MSTRFFASYSHADWETVAPELKIIESHGIDIWYDSDVRGGALWADELAEAIEAARAVVFFVTPRSAKSEFCYQEISHALTVGTPVIAIHLEPTVLTSGLQLLLGSRQAILRWNLDPAGYLARLDEALDFVTRSPVQIGRREHQAPIASIFRVGQPRNPDFIGRTELLQLLHQNLEPSSGVNVVALAGMGGVGKTQVALEYAHQFSDEYDLVVWLPAEEPEHLASEYAALSRVLKLDLDENSQTTTKIEAVREWLEHHSRWLLIFDNIPNPSALISYLPRTGTGKCLLTSRHQLWGNYAHKIAIGVMIDKDASDFLIRRCPETSESRALELATELGFLPLALDSAASYIEATGRSVDEYLRLLKTHQARLLAASPASAFYESNILSAWDLSVRTIGETDLLSLEVFRLLCMLAPDTIPLALIRNGFDKLGDPFEKLGHDELLLDQCIATLSRYSLVQNKEGDLYIHRIVQLVSREHNPELERFAALGVDLIDSVFAYSGLEGDRTPETAQLLPHALAVLDHAQDYASSHDTVARLLRRTGSYLSATGRHTEGLEHLKRAVDLFKSGGDSKSRHFVRTIGSLGFVEYAIGDTKSAETNLTQAVDITEEVYGEDLRLAQELIGLCWVLRTNGRLESALRHISRSLAIAERLVPDTPLVGMPLSTKARIEWDIGMLDAAYTDASVARDHLDQDGLNHPLFAGMLNHVAQVLFDFGDVAGAQHCAQRAYTLAAASYTLEHPIVVIALGILGATQLLSADYEGAVETLDRTVKAGVQASVWLHEDVARRRSDLSAAYLALGDIEKAREHAYTAVAELSKVCGAVNCAEGRTRAALAQTLIAEERFEEADRECTWAIDALNAYYPADHPAFLHPLSLRGSILFTLGRIEEAGTIFTAAQRCARHLPIPHFELGKLHERMAALYLDDDRDLAVEHYRIGLDHYSGSLGPENPVLNQIMAQLELYERGDT